MSVVVVGVPPYCVYMQSRGMGMEESREFASSQQCVGWEKGGRQQYTTDAFARGGHLVGKDR